MSNKIALATIQFRADARGVNPALNSLRQSSKDAHDEIDRLQEALDKGFKTLKDGKYGGGEYDVAKQLKKATQEANSFDKAINELLKGATALESVVKNIRMGEIERSSRAELRGAIKGAEARKRSVRGSDPEDLAQQRDLEKVIEESRKQLNNLDRDTEKIIETIRNGGTIAEATLNKEIKGLREILTLTEKGSDEWNKYNAQLTVLSDKVKSLAIEEQRISGQKMLGKAFRGDFATADRKTLEDVIAKLREYQSVINDPNGTGARIFAATEKQIQALSEQLAKTKGDIVSVEQALQVLGQAGASIEQMEQSMKVLEAARKKATEPAEIYKLDEAIGTLNQKIKESTGEWMSLKQAEDIASKAGGDGFIATAQQMQQATAAIERQRDSLIKIIQQKQRDGKATKDEEAELARLDKVLKDLKFEQDNFNMSHKQMEDLLKQPKSAEDLEQLKAAIKRADGELKRMKQLLGENKKQYQEFAKQVKNAKIELKQMEDQSKAAAGTFEKAWSRLKTYISLYVGAAVAMQKITQTLGDLMTLSDKMGEVRKTTGYTADEVGRLSDNLAKLDTRTPIENLLSISARGGQLGLKSMEDIQGFTEAANKLMVALPEMGDESATELMKISKATGDLKRNNDDVQETLERVGSTIIALRANSASAAPAITDFVKRVGAVGAQAGITIDQIAALGSTVDALGGRVEMSATALSRMIPAIKNNSFAVAQALKIPERELKEMSGMEQMVAVFRKLHDSVKGFDMTTEEGMNAAADAVENMLGRSTSMQDVMKTLNQQGARAGIVFGLLSQNVDELEKQLETATEAYSKNTALMNEYSNMNETTAAKWEKLKNQLEEFFVSDKAQRQLGNLIDMLRGLVDLITGNVTGAWRKLNTALWMAAAYFTTLRLGIGKLVVEGFGLLIKGVVGLKTAIMSLVTAQGRAGLIGTIQKAVGVTRMYIAANLTLAFSHDVAAKAAARATLANNALAKSLKANVILAVIAAIGMLIYKMHEWNEKAKEASKQWGAMDEAILKETSAVDTLFHKVAKLREQERLSAEQAKAHADKEELLTKGIKQTTEATTAAAAETGKLSEKMDEAAQKADKVEDGLQRVNIEGRESAAIIRKINSQYGQYLGYMLSETSSAQQLAAARDLINKKLRETITLKQQEAALGNVETEYGGKVNKKAASMERTLEVFYGKDYETSAKVSVAITEAANKYAKDKVNFEKAVREILSANKISELDDDYMETFENYRKSVEEYQNQSDVVNRRFEAANKINRKASQQAAVNDLNAILSDWKDLLAQYKKAEGEEKEKLAVEVYKQQKDYVDALANNADYFKNTKYKAAFEKNIENMQTYEKGLRAVAGKAIEDIDNGATNGGGGGGNPYGDYNKVTSAYSEWNGNDLVARRKEMLERVKALANGADVQAVLSEDAKFISDAVRNNIKTTEQAIEWYNTERLKIQDALHGKHLTNTGDWLDPKKGAKRASRMVQDEMKYYLDELDAYYTERKAEIQEDLNDEVISEAEARNRTLTNEAEWQQRRAELQLLYSKRRGEVIEQEQEAIYNIISERTGETSDYIKADILQTIRFIETIGRDKSKAAMDRIYGDIELKAEQSFLRQRNAIGKHIQDITNIVNKENPFNGIVDGLRKNLGTMDLLLTDITDDAQRTADKEIERTMFLLEQSTKGYGLTWQQLMGEMAEKGWQAWADAINADTQMQSRLMHQVYQVFEKVQDAIKKEASELKKQADIMWSNLLLPGGDGKTTIKDAFEQAIGALGIEEGRVSRANSLIGAGQASERVADKLAIQQMKVQLAMQRYQYNLTKKIAEEKVESLRKEAELEESLGHKETARSLRMQADNAEQALNLATRKEQTEELKMQEQIIARTEESQARLYKELREWGDLIASSLQSVMEASNAGNAEYYNELAKLNLTGKGGPGAGTYIVIENEGTEDAEAHYEYLNEREALERQREIEQQNAQADAWKKVMDDLNQNMSDMITDQMNSLFMQANTDATIANTNALIGLTQTIAGQASGEGITRNAEGMAVDSKGEVIYPIQPTEPTEQKTEGGAPASLWPMSEEHKEQIAGWNNELWQRYGEAGVETMQTMADATAEMPSIVTDPFIKSQEQAELISENTVATSEAVADAKIAASDRAAQAELDNQQKVKQGELQTDKQMQASGQSLYAKLTAAANLYGVAYQAMSNDNLSTMQKFEMIALQAAGNAAIAALTATNAENTGKTTSLLPLIFGKCVEINPIAGAAIFAAITAVLGGLMGVAASKISKSKSEIAQITGTSASAGRLSTGMQTYAEGNVNEFTDPSSLTPGRSYNVDGADGRTYRAKYMGKDAKTHITNGPEFHLVGERGKEAIIDAHTTRLMQMDDTGIWQAIQTLYNGGSLTARRHRSAKRGMPAFADGNLDQFEDMDEMVNGGSSVVNGFGMEQMLAFQQSLDRNSAIMERLAEEGIEAFVSPYGKRGIVNGYDTYKKEALRHGERY